MSHSETVFTTVCKMILVEEVMRKQYARWHTHDLPMGEENSLCCHHNSTLASLRSVPLSFPNKFAANTEIIPS